MTIGTNQMLCNVLEGSNKAREAKTVVSNGGTHTERRLHQMMLEDRDFERNSCENQSRLPSISRLKRYYAAVADLLQLDVQGIKAEMEKCFYSFLRSHHSFGWVDEWADTGGILGIKSFSPTLGPVIICMLMSLDNSCIAIILVPLHNPPTKLTFRSSMTGAPTLSSSRCGEKPENSITFRYSIGYSISVSPPSFVTGIASSELTDSAVGARNASLS
ncbi:ACT domain-containing protein ACR4 isoform X2 [Tanacetum coccineum]